MVDLHSAHHSGDTQCSARVLHYRALHTNTRIISSSPGGNICFFVPKKIRETWSESSLWHGDRLTKVCKTFCAFVVGLRTKLVNMQYLANTSGSRCSFAKELSLCDRRGVTDAERMERGRKRELEPQNLQSYFLNLISCYVASSCFHQVLSISFTLLSRMTARERKPRSVQNTVFEFLKNLLVPRFLFS